MRKVEFYITRIEDDEEEMLVRTEFYWRTIRAILHVNHWISIGEHFHCKVYEDTGIGKQTGRPIWEQIESKVEPIGSTGNAKG